MAASGRTRAAGTLPETQVRAMFDRIAGVYDLMNSVMTAGHAPPLARAGGRPGARSDPATAALDVATGTGDLAVELRRRVGADGEVIGSDFSERDARAGAREGARARASSRATRSSWPTTDDSFDAATVGFGARNFSDLPRACARWRASTRPGGRVVILEITTPQRPPLSWFFRLWFDRVVPLLGRLAGDSGRLQLPAELRAPLPGPARAGRRSWRPPGLERRALGAHGRRDHRHPRRHSEA